MCCIGFSSLTNSKNELYGILHHLLTKHCLINLHLASDKSDHNTTWMDGITSLCQLLKHLGILYSAISNVFPDLK